MSTFPPTEGEAPAESAPVEPDSTDSESTAPSTESPTPQDGASGAETDHDPNVTWGADDPQNPDFSLADAPVEPSSSESEEAV